MLIAHNQFPATITSLRVMHCPDLNSPQGIQSLRNIKTLNLSSNNLLSMQGLQSLTQLSSLNLSCNKIQTIPPLQMPNLRTLNLSHNRITSIKPLESLSDSRLQELDLTDNYIGELSQIKSLSELRYLRTLHFRVIGQEAKGSNPICDFSNYEITIRMHLNQLQ